MKKYLPFIIIMSIVLHGKYLLNKSYEIRYSHTPSLEHSLFLIEKKVKEYSKSDYVAFYYKGQSIYHYEHNEPFMKIASCVEGEMLTTTEDYSYYCNGKFLSQAILKDSFNHKLAHFVYNGVVPKGSFFATGTHPRSYDSKYWGFVKDADIIGRGVGLL